MGLEQIIKYLLGEASVIAHAPVSFAACILIGWGIVWFIYKLRFTDRIAALEERLRLKDDRLAEYKDKLSGASPDEAKAKIAALEHAVNSAIGHKWEPLGADEIKRLSAAVAPLEKRRLQVMYANQLGKNLARSFADAFEAAGWPVVFSEGGGLEIGVSTGRGNGMALTLKRAIEETTRFKSVHSFGPDEPDTPNIAFVAVGINLNPS